MSYFGCLESYWTLCDIIFGLLECVIETAVVLVCLPFMPFVCIASYLCPSGSKETPEEQNGLITRARAERESQRDVQIGRPKLVLRV